LDVQSARRFLEANELLKGTLVVDGGGHPSPEANARITRAIPLLMQVLESDRTNWEVAWLIGRAHETLSDYALALQWFVGVQRFVPNHPDVAREAGICAMESGQPQVAIEQTLIALRSAPGDLGLTTNLAMMYLFAGDLNQALRTANEAFRTAPDNAHVQATRRIIAEVIDGKRPLPRHRRDLNSTQGS